METNVICLQAKSPSKIMSVKKKLTYVLLKLWLLLKLKFVGTKLILKLFCYRSSGDKVT